MTAALRSFCVFCGSSDGAHPDYARAAADLGRRLAGRGARLVYGGARVGTMGVLADAVLAAGGPVLGIIPGHMARAEVAHDGLTDLVVVDTMHERKAAMAAAADAFVALPGGLGTLEELAEMTTWAQLGLHAKPVGLLNVRRFWDPLLDFLDHAVAEGFLRPVHRGRLVVADDPAGLLSRLDRWRPPAGGGGR